MCVQRTWVGRPSPPCERSRQGRAPARRRTRVVDGCVPRSGVSGRGARGRGARLRRAIRQAERLSRPAGLGEAVPVGGGRRDRREAPRGLQDRKRPVGTRLVLKTIWDVAKAAPTYVRIRPGLTGNAVGGRSHTGSARGRKDPIERFDRGPHGRCVLGPPGRSAPLTLTGKRHVRAVTRAAGPPAPARCAAARTSPPAARVPAAQVLVPRLRRGRGLAGAVAAARHRPLPTWEAGDGHQVDRVVREALAQLAHRGAALIAREGRAAERRDEQPAVLEAAEHSRRS